MELHRHRECVPGLAGLEFLLARQPQPNWPPRRASQEACDYLMLANFGLRPEPAAHADLVADDLLLLQAKDGGDFLRDVIGGLGGGPEFELLVALIPARDRYARLHAGV